MEELVKQKGTLRRFLQTSLARGKKDERTTLTFAASSEEPVERWYGMEVLSHEKSAVRLVRATAGAMPLLFNHNTDDPIGMITGARLEGERMVVDAELFDTARSQEVMKMVEGGLRNVSLAYRVNVIEEDKKTETYRVTDWEPYEVSIVTVPADHTVGIGRNELEYEVRMVRASQPAPVIGAIPAGGPMSEVMPTPAPVAPTPALPSSVELESQRSANALELEKNRKRGIENLCKMAKLDDKYRDMWVGQGLSIEEVSDELLRVLEERGKSNPMPATRLGLSTNETQSFSLMRAIRACAEKDWKNAGFELECSRAVSKRINGEVDPNKFYVPFEVLTRQLPVPMKRDLTVATAGAGGYLVETQNVGFIEILRNRSVAFTMGVRRLSGLTGSLTIPRQSAAATAVWLANEAATLTESQQIFVQVALTPKSVGAYTEISRQLLLQSSPAAEGIVTDDLAQVVAVATDLAVLNGSGASGQPTGIIGTAGIGGVTGTSIAYAGILEFQTDVAGANVNPVSGGYVTTPAVAALLMQRQRFTSTDTPLWAGNVWDGQVSGFRALSSNQVPAANILFGDWSEVVVGEWGVLEVEVNPYANFQAGIIGVRAIYSLDVGVRRPFAFSLATSVT